MKSQVYIIDGYTDKQSYRAGEMVNFFTRIDVWDEYFNGDLLLKKRATNQAVELIQDFSPNLQYTRNYTNPYANGFNYEATKTWQVPSSLPSFVYYVGAINPIPIIIKGDKNNVDVVIVYPTNTQNAYCPSGGKSSYGDGPIPMSPILSFNRPLDVLNGETGNGFNAGFLRWIDAADRFEGKTVGFISDADMEDYSEIEHAKLLIIIGHSEYWTRKARENFDRFVDEGNDALVLSGNTMWWQVRLQNDPNNPDNKQMLCYKHKDWPDFIDDICDPLLVTNNWNDQSLKFSTLASIGSDWSIGGFSGDKDESVSPLRGFTVQKIILPNSPIFQNAPLSYNPANNSYNIDPYKNKEAEVDGVLVKGFDANGYPIINKEAYGFYKAELLTYDFPSYQTNTIDPLPLPQPPYYTGVMAFQKTCNSGRVINVNNNQWCNQEVLGYRADIQQTTQNMISLMLNGNNIFLNEPISPSQFKITPSTNSISYEACANGSIKISPCGVSITDGYKLDATSAPFYAKNIDCSSCNRGARLANNKARDINQINDIKLNSAILVKKFTIYPNPNEGKFFIETSFVEANDLTVVLQTIDNKIVLQEKYAVLPGNNKIMIEKQLNAGIYVLKIVDTHSKSLLKISKLVVNY